MSFALILPFLGPLADLVSNDAISEIMVNGDGRVYIERAGLLQHVPDIALDPHSLRIGVQTIARLLNDDFGEEKPLLDARLPDGSRVAAVLPPCSVDGGITVAIRKFGARHFSPEQLVALGTVSPDVLTTIAAAIRDQQNVLISGGTGSGKTTLLNALATFIPDTERLIVIEDTSELQLAKPNLVRLEARRAQPPAPAVTIRDLVRASLRLRPDRIILGEVRGGEAFDLLQALNTGHSGSMTTIHANNATLALTRLANCVMMSDVALPYPAIRASLANTIHLIVHIARNHQDGRRLVAELVSVGHYHPDRDAFTLHKIYGEPSCATPSSSPAV